MRTNGVIVFSVLVCLSQPALAATWHVATTGSDSAAGTEQAPWRTIQRAADAVAAGDTVVVHAGTYAGFVVSAIGTQSAPITFRTDGDVHIDGAVTAERDAILVLGGEWITIEGFTVTRAARAGIAALDCANVTVRRNRVDQNARWGVFSSFCDDLVVEYNEASRSGTEHGVYASNSADRPIIRNNLIWGNGMCGVHMNGDINFGGDGVISGAVIENNIIRDNGLRGGSAINGDGVAGALIRNNVLDGNHASGISLYRIDGGAPSTGNRVINNTVRMASSSRSTINIQNGSTGNIIRNNILLNATPGRGAIDICSTCLAGSVSNHNAVVGRFLVGGVVVDLAGWRTRTGHDAASFATTDGELFASATDLALEAGSPAIDRGIADDAPEADITGTLRPQGASIDIGAYEHCDGACVGADDGSGDGGTGDGGDGSGEDDGDGGDGGGGPDYSGPVVAPEVEPIAGGCAATRAGSSLGLVLVVAMLGIRRRRRR